jgi:hypothetical protein
MPRFPYDYLQQDLSDSFSILSSPKERSLTPIVKDKIRSFEAYLTMTVQSLIMHQNSEMFRIPADLRKMTMKQVKETWGGSLGGTVMRIKREQIEMEERERMRLEAEERRIKEREAAKRFV